VPARAGRYSATRSRPAVRAVNGGNSVSPWASRATRVRVIVDAKFARSSRRIWAVVGGGPRTSTARSAVATQSVAEAHESVPGVRAMYVGLNADAPADGLVDVAVPPPSVVTASQKLAEGQERVS
jgi:hypothetical protein